MKDLDKRIADLKGWREPTMEEHKTLVERDGANRTPMNLPLYFLVPKNHPATPPWNVVDMTKCNWSTSDSKALELVDELNELGFLVIVSSWRRRPEMGAGPCCTVVIESFASSTRFHRRNQDVSRPEAICRAYIAAREWMATKATENAWRKGEEDKDKSLRSELGL